MPLLAAAALSAQQQFVTIEQVEGITSFAHVETRSPAAARSTRLRLLKSGRLASC
jgi:hypothetical protein